MTETETETFEGDTWEAQHLRSLLASATDPDSGKRLTQERLGKLAGIDRSRLNGLLRAKHAITPTYAERLAPHLGVLPESLLPPAEQSQEVPESPLVLLRKLGATVEAQQRQLDEIQERVEILERAGRSPRRASKAGR